MSVGPIDAIRAQEATQLKHMDTQRAQHVNEQQSRNFQNMVKQDLSKPKKTSKADNTEYRYDSKEKGNNQYTGSNNKHKKKEDSKSDSKNGKNTSNGGGIDILI